MHADVRRNSYIFFFFVHSLVCTLTRQLASSFVLYNQNIRTLIEPNSMYVCARAAKSTNRTMSDADVYKSRKTWTQTKWLWCKLYRLYKALVYNWYHSIFVSKGNLTAVNCCTIVMINFYDLQTMALFSHSITVLFDCILTGQKREEKLNASIVVKRVLRFFFHIYMYINSIVSFFPHSFIKWTRL